MSIADRLPGQCLRPGCGEEALAAMLFGVDTAGNIAGCIGTAVLRILRMGLLCGREKRKAAAKAYNRALSARGYWADGECDLAKGSPVSDG